MNFMVKEGAMIKKLNKCQWGIILGFLIVLLIVFLWPGKIYSEQDNCTQNYQTTVDKITSQQNTNPNQNIVDIQGNSTSRRGPNGNDRIIIQFKDWYKDQKKQTKLVLKHKGWIIKYLKKINGLAAVVPEEELSALEADPVVLRVEKDLDVFSFGIDDDDAEDDAEDDDGKKGPAEVIPWGIQRIWADQVWGDDFTGDKIKVAILDTGISYIHYDLKWNINKKKDCVQLWGGSYDFHGHGTHMAGIIAALDNKIGVVGVAPKADIYAVKVLWPDGTGWLSDLIEGLEWCIDEKVDVINMSLGCLENSEALYEAILQVYEAGITMVAAAGNNDPNDIPGEVIYPAKYIETIAVSALGHEDTFATFSRSGPEVDLIAPGVDILSTYKNKSYAEKSGTSVAAAHVTGVVALLLKTKNDVYDPNSNKKWDPDEVKYFLKVNAEYLVLLSLEQQGAGLVKAGVVYR